MKQFFALFLSLILITPAFAQDGQEEINEVDPRQYVSIVEDEENPDVPEKVWSYDTIQRKVKKVSRKSILRVSFDKKLLSENPDFIGNFAITAQINDRDIEVTPYSVVGQNEYRIGFEANSATDNANFFLSLLIEASSIDTIWDRYAAIFTDRSKVYLNQKVNELIEYYNRTGADSVTNIREEQHYELFNKISNVSMYVPESSVLAVYLEKPKLFQNREVLSELNSISARIQGGQISGEIPKGVKIKAYSEIFKLMEYTLNYIQNFKSSGEEAMDAYLSLIQRDRLFLERTQMKLEENMSIMSVVDTMTDRGFERFSRDLREATLETHSTLMKLSDIKGTFMAQTLKNSGFKDLKDLRRKNRKAVVDKISDATGRDIFKRLVYASIDLAKESADRGDKLTIYMNWYVEAGTSSLPEGAPLQLHVATFQIK